MTRKTLPTPASASALVGCNAGPVGNLEAALAEVQEHWWRIQHDIESVVTDWRKADFRAERQEINQARAAKRPRRRRAIPFKPTLRPMKPRVDLPMAS